MEEIANNVFIENNYPNVVLGVLKLDHGLLMVDAPFRGPNLMSWRKKLISLGGGIDKILVMLDSHIDRTLGIPAMEFKVLGHQNVVDIIGKRPTTARGQDVDAGADWEADDLPENIHWALPDITYKDELLIYWNDEPVIITHQPGAHIAGSWVRYNAEKVIFVGDSVVVNQPPFLAWSDLDIWLQELDWLKSEAFNGYKIVSGRNAVVKPHWIDQLVDFLTAIKARIPTLAMRDGRVEAITDAVSQLIKELDYEKTLTDPYVNRLVWGLEHYLQRHYPGTN